MASQGQLTLQPSDINPWPGRGSVQATGLNLYPSRFILSLCHCQLSDWSHGYPTQLALTLWLPKLSPSLITWIADQACFLTPDSAWPSASLTWVFGLIFWLLASLLPSTACTLLLVLVAPLDPEWLSDPATDIMEWQMYSKWGFNLA